jgi:hypothetical protein
VTKLSVDVFVRFRAPLHNPHFDEIFAQPQHDTWFGARRHMLWLKWLPCLDLRIKDYFSRLQCLPESDARLADASATDQGPMNHCFQHYVQSHPRLLSQGERLKASPAFFGRKFPNDPAAWVSHSRVLAEMVVYRHDKAGPGARQPDAR